ncbi:MAG: 50S ribosomal protein L15e [Candidatus Altiarchaeota archaeon]|nr:50S ribosomal protein L15e [Candidatus Altiarchaeota archaeon]
MGYLKYVRKLYSDSKSMKELAPVLAERKKTLRGEPPIVRVQHPTRPDRARQYGYRAKQGYAIARVKIRAGGLRKKRPSRGRKPAGMGINKITAGKSIQRMAEERAAKKYTNMEVLASYWVYKDGKTHWYEVIMIDPSHPAIKSDKKINWITKATPGRAVRGKTPAGKKGRGQRKKGMGTEKNRPSLGANQRRAK